MKFLKRKGDESTIRKVWNDDKTILYGVIGTVEDMLKVTGEADATQKSFSIPAPAKSGQ